MFAPEEIYAARIEAAKDPSLLDTLNAQISVAAEATNLGREHADLMRDVCAEKDRGIRLLKLRSAGKHLEALAQRAAERAERERSATDPFAWRHAIGGFNPLSTTALHRAKELKAACDRMQTRMSLIVESFGKHRDETDLRAAIADLNDAARAFTASLGMEQKESIRREKESA